MQIYIVGDHHGYARECEEVQPARERGCDDDLVGSHVLHRVEQEGRPCISEYSFHIPVSSFTKEE